MKNVAGSRAAPPPRARASARDTQVAKEAINAAIEILHRRWVLRVLWELRAEPLTFRALQAACGDLSPTVLNTRLAELREAALVVHQPGLGYALTPLGAELLEVLKPLLKWAIGWRQATAPTGPRGGG